MEPKYLGIVTNEQDSDGNGLVVITAGPGELEEAIFAIFSERIRSDLEYELRYQHKDSAQFDYSKVPDFVKKLATKSSDGKEFILRPTEEQYQAEFGLTIEYECGFLYNIEVHDLSDSSQELKSQLESLEQNKFIFLHEIDMDLELELRDQLDISF